MTDIKCKLYVKHKPSESPGSWYDSKLTLSLIGDKNLIVKVEKAIKEALSKE